MENAKATYGQWDIYKNGAFMVSIPYVTQRQAIERYAEYHRVLLSDKIEARPTTRGIIVSCWCQVVCTGHGD